MWKESNLEGGLAAVIARYNIDLVTPSSRQPDGSHPGLPTSRWEVFFDICYLYTTQLCDDNNTTLDVCASPDKDRVCYIGVRATPPGKDDIKDIFWFVNNRPELYIVDGKAGDRLPDNHNPFPESFIGPFEELERQFGPALALSLGKCILPLFRRGPRYDSESGNKYDPTPCRISEEFDGT